MSTCKHGSYKLANRNGEWGHVCHQCGKFWQMDEPLPRLEGNITGQAPEKPQLGDKITLKRTDGEPGQEYITSTNPDGTITTSNGRVFGEPVREDSKQDTHEHHFVIPAVYEKTNTGAYRLKWLLCECGQISDEVKYD